MLTSIWTRLPLFRFVGSAGAKRMSCAQRLLISTNKQEKVDVLKVNLTYEKAGYGPHPILCLPGALGLFLMLYLNY